MSNFIKLMRIILEGAEVTPNEEKLIKVDAELRKCSTEQITLTMTYMANLHSLIKENMIMKNETTVIIIKHQLISTMQTCPTVFIHLL